MATEQSVQAVIGLTGFRTYSTGFPTSREQFMRLELPPRFDREHVMQAQRDFEILAKRAAEYPQEMVELQNAVLAYDLPRAISWPVTSASRRASCTTRAAGPLRSRSWAGSSALLLAVVLSSDEPSPPPPPPRPVGPEEEFPHRRRCRRVSSRARVAM